MSVLKLIASLFNFNRMLVFFVFGLVSIFIDSRIMGKKGLKKESFWAKVFGYVLIFAGVLAWAASIFIE